MLGVSARTQNNDFPMDSSLRGVAHTRVYSSGLQGLS